MSWQDDVIAEQEAADALEYMGEAEWRDMYGEDRLDRKLAEDRKKRSEYNARYWAEHKEQISAHRKEIYKRDKDKIDARHNRWVDANRERWNAYMRDRRKKAKLDKKTQA